MHVPFEGGCACDLIRYRCAARPFPAVQCRCRDCRAASGSPYVSMIAVPAAGYALSRGTPKLHRIEARCGRMLLRGFCRECGTPVSIRSPQQPNVVLIQTSSIDDPQPLNPPMAARALPPLQDHFRAPSRQTYFPALPAPDHPLFCMHA